MIGMGYLVKYSDIHFLIWRIYVLYHRLVFDPFLFRLIILQDFQLGLFIFMLTFSNRHQPAVFKDFRPVNFALTLGRISCHQTVNRLHLAAVRIVVPAPGRLTQPLNLVIEHTESGSQQFNPLELELARPLIDACVRYLSLDGRNGIGVVVPHRAQKALLKAQFPMLTDVNSIDTVERFQGDERDVIIVSATASDTDFVRSEADFLLNLNRLNVAISRPRKKLIVIASRAVVDLLTSDLEVFENAVIWKRLYHQYTPDILHEHFHDGYRVTVRGRAAQQ